VEADDQEGETTVSTPTAADRSKDEDDDEEKEGWEEEEEEGACAVERGAFIPAPDA
jgi:hypothetical protein